MPVNVPMREFRWQILARWVTAVLLALFAAIAGIEDYVESVWPLFAVCGVIVLYNLSIVAAGLLRARPYEVTLVSQVLDIIALTVFLHYAGDIENPLSFAYSIPVVAGAVIVSKRSGFFLAGVGSLLFLSMVCATLVDAFPIHLQHHHLNLVPGFHLSESVDPDVANQGWHYVLAHTLTLTSVLFASAYGFGTLSERIREKEDQLERDNDRLQLLLSILPEGVVLIARDGRIMVANLAANELVGAQAGMPITDLERVGIADQFQAFQSRYQEFETVHNDRRLNHILARGPSQEPIVWIIRDLTDHHRLMAQLMHQSKMADLGLLGAGIAHEIGNPLSSILAIIQLIQMRQVAPDFAESMNSIRSNVDRMNRILQNFRDFSRPSIGKRRTVAVEELIEKALQIFRMHEKSRNMSVEVSSSNGSISVNVVDDQIVQVLLNLLLNAADASSNTGSITVKSSRQDGHVVVDIIDKGSGISPRVRDHLFTPFFTTKDPGKGVGLGLFISDAIVRSHGGRINVKSEPRTGSTFTVILPNSEAARS